MISEEYRALNAGLHAVSARYGTTAEKHAETILSVIEETGAESVLDYGCGKMTLMPIVRHLVDYRPYDPAIQSVSAMPVSADVVVCTDVMEHVEPEFVDSVIRHIDGLTQKAAVFSISCIPGDRLLPDGSNTHRTVMPPKWWADKLACIGAVEIIHQDAAEVVCVVRK